MKTYISLLRGINVSGQKKMPMAGLRELYESLGLADVRTYVQSGNVVFASHEKDTEKLSKTIEALIERSFGYQVSVFIRATKDIQRVMNSNSFLSKRKEDPTKLHVTFLYRSPTENAWDKLVMKSAQGDEFIAGEKEIYVFCPNGYGRTKWTNNYFEKKLRVAATTRNWKTINTLYAMAAGQYLYNHDQKNDNGILRT